MKQTRSKMFSITIHGNFKFDQIWSHDLQTGRWTWCCGGTANRRAGWVAAACWFSIEFSLISVSLRFMLGSSKKLRPGVSEKSKKGTLVLQEGGESAQGAAQRAAGSAALQRRPRTWSVEYGVVCCSRILINFRSFILGCFEFDLSAWILLW